MTDPTPEPDDLKLLPGEQPLPPVEIPQVEDETEEEEES